MKKNELENLGEFKLREDGEATKYFVTVNDYTEIATTPNTLYSDADKTKTLTVYDTGLYFGTVDEYYQWLEGEILDYLVREGKITRTFDNQNFIYDYQWID